ncbi:Hypothetical protein SCF082_LOCUS410 [Durusdinium trenchii]|uniref:Uncharacterized protein n=1 Tax=Durusdinium trenchii TaxID=1381693 RepID=A0ABP0H7C6_9DINO
MFPGYKDKIWAKLPQGVKEYQVKSANDAFEKHIKQHQTWQGYLLAWKDQRIACFAVVFESSAVRAPFTEAEWEERKQYRSWDLVKFGYGLLALFLGPEPQVSTFSLIRKRG